MIEVQPDPQGIVYLVGAGPGDPDLLTLKAQELLQACDVVVFDYLVNPVILRHVRAGAERLFIGKPRQSGRLSQSEVEQILIDRSRLGKQVVRLKGGDPFIFGRGGEEAQTLTRASVRWEVVPGVSAGHAAPAYAGIPLTHRELASSVAFVTGHESEHKSFVVNWSQLATAVETLVIFMGVKNLPHIVAELIAAGREPTTPAAVIESGTFSEQRVVSGRLDSIVRTVAAAEIKSPALTVIGDVAGLHDELDWFRRRQASQTTRYNLEVDDEVFAAVS
ncbi:uroporphyrinogen-III C-methyltransferase [bacterium]|nr:uroporphyrinogen-III C-methyltransferase [bacterium]